MELDDKTVGLMKDRRFVCKFEMRTVNVFTKKRINKVNLCCLAHRR